MRRFLKRFPFNKVFVTLFVLFYTLVPPVQALGAILPTCTGALLVPTVGDPVCYGTIQEAVDAASSGDSIEVSSGTYDENLLIDKDNLLIEGIDVIKPVINPTGTPPSTKRLVDIRGSNVTFKNFEIIGNNNLTPTGWVGIAIPGQNNTIEGNDIKDLLTGIQTNTQNTQGNNQILDNNISHTSVGISLQNDTNIVTGNSLSDIAGEGFGLINTSSSTFENNSLDVNTTGINAKDYSSDPLSYINFSDFIANNTFTRLVTRTNSLGEILGDKLYVNIQDAIDNAVSGDTILINPGTYLEENYGWTGLKVAEKSLKFLGAGNQRTFVKVPTKTNGIEFHGDMEVWIEGITFTSDDQGGPANFLRFGEIPSVYNSITLKDIIVENSTSNNVQLGKNGLYKNINIESSTFQHAGSWGFLASGEIEEMTILNSDFLHNGQTDAAHGIGLDFSGPGPYTNITVDGGNFSYNKKAGINMQMITNSVFKNLIASNNAGSDGFGIKIDEWTGKTENILIENILAQNNALDGITISPEKEDATENILISKSILSNNGRAGLGLWYINNGSNNPEMKNISIEKSSIYDNGSYGIQVGSWWVPLNITEVFSARNNWWGDLSGPYNATSNPTGTGDAVSDNVEFCPWLDSEDGDPFGPCIDDEKPVIESVSYFNNSSPITEEGTGIDPAYVKSVSDLSYNISFSDDLKLGKHVFVIYQENPEIPGAPYWVGNGGKAYCSFTGTNNTFPLEGTHDSLTNISFENCTSELPDGRYVVINRVYDAVGKLTSSYDLTFVVDSALPIVELTSIVKGQFYKGEIDLRATATEGNPESYRLYLRHITPEGKKLGVYNSGWVPIEEGFVDQSLYKWDSTTSKFGDGTYRVRFDVIDKAGNWKHDLIDIEVDNTKPKGSIDYIYYPSKDLEVNKFITNDNTPILGGTCVDENLNLILLEVDGKEQNLSCDQGTWRSAPLDTLGDGTYTMFLKMRDLSGNETIIEQDITIDTIAPTALHTYFKNGVEITDSMAYVKGTSDLTFLAEYYEEGSGIYQDSYVIFDSNEEGTARTSTAYCGWRKPGNTLLITENPLTTPVPFTNCSSTLLDGAYFMYHQVYDNATRQDIPTINQFRDHKGLYFIVDSVAPTSTITTPSSGYITNEEPEIIGYTEDTYSVDKVVLSYTDYDTDTQQCGTDWTELTTITNNDKELLPFDWSYSEWNLEDGAYCIKAQGTDLAGNEENTAIIENVIYDTTPPQITLLDLVLGVLRDVDANDPLSGIAKIEVSTDNLTWQDYTSDLDLNDLVGNQPGTYTIYIRVTDKAGNITTETVTFTIPSPTPTTTPTAGDILGVTSPLNPTPVQASYGIGGYTLAQTDEQDTEQEEITEEEIVTQDNNPEVKGEEDNEEQDGEEGETKWWIYPLVILPILAIFLILWKRRKEDNEPQF